jgi:predicted nuclease with TOPRIM domain
MLPTAFHLSITEIVILTILAIVSALIFHFIWTNRKNMQHLLEREELRITLAGAGNFSNSMEETKKRPTRKVKLFNRTALHNAGVNTYPLQDQQAGLELRSPINNAGLRNAIKNFYDPSLIKMKDDDSCKEKTAALKIEVETMQLALDEKANELQKVKQQYSTAQKLASRMDDMYKEYDLLQQKISDLEAQGSRAAALAIELENAKESCAQLKKDLGRKQVKLQETITENTQLHQDLNEVEDKLEEANLQRKQLMKRVQFLETINTEFQQVSDTNKKLQNEIRRIGELESMLSMIADERDTLLQRKR